LPGQYYDAETGLHYNGFRDYDPGTGRYVEPDPIGLAGGLNVYGYVGGDPVNRVDPDGRWWSLAWQILRTMLPIAMMPSDDLPGLGSTGGGLGKLKLPNCPGVAREAEKFDLDAMAKAAAAPDKGGLTRAGRALDKHGAGQRSADSPFPAPKGGPASKNAMGQEQVEDILTHPDAEFTRLGRGGTSVRVPDGREIRFDADGRFAGFIE
jgi:RHS repeat-associated protein